MNFRARSSQGAKRQGRFAGMMRGAILAALGMLMLLANHSTALAAGDAAKGKVAFAGNCARCHSAALEKKGTGPALMGVSSRIPGGDWRYEWVRNSAKLIQSGDAYAVKIYNENAKAAMDPFPALPKETIDDIFAWIDSYTVGPGGPTGGDPTVDPSKDAGLSSLWNWIRLLIFVIVVLMVNIAIQVARLRGVEILAGIHLDKLNARLMLAFYVLGAIGAVWSSISYSPYFLANNAASVHGVEIDQLFWITMAIVFGVFLITNGALFFFAWKYGKDGDRKAMYYPENHKLELIWTVVPAIVLAVLIIFGIKTWTGIMSPPDPSKALVKVEVNGQQWGWTLRYPGADNTFGDLDVHRIGGDNLLGLDFSTGHVASHDDFLSDTMFLPKGATIDLKIRSRDVLHSVYLPHFRVKMDAVPGMDTRFHFVTNQTSAEFREKLIDHVYWGQIDTIVTTTIKKGDTLSDKSIAQMDISRTDTIHKADKFDFELACAEVCGRGHYSMRKVVVVLEQKDYDKWLARASMTPMYSAMKHDDAAEFPSMAARKEGTSEAQQGIVK
jgi:cytochrome c oxidase subunit II